MSDEAAAPAPASAPAAGDLFAHFGLSLDARGPRRPRPLVEVAACSHCGWWLATTQVEQHVPCPVCGTPS